MAVSMEHNTENLLHHHYKFLVFTSHYTHIVRICVLARLLYLISYLSRARVQCTRISEGGSQILQ